MLEEGGLQQRRPGQTQTDQARRDVRETEMEMEMEIDGGNGAPDGARASHHDELILSPVQTKALTRGTEQMHCLDCLMVGR